MGTNYYYFQKPKCEGCGQNVSEEMHIGKSSYGWCFSLHVIPEDNINTLDDWIRLFEIEGSYILDEYGGAVTKEAMLNCITNRSHPKGLIRHDIDGRHCVGFGDGTWDYIKGVFS